MGSLLVIIIAGAVLWAVINAARQAKILLAAKNTFISEHAGWDIYHSAWQTGVLAIHHDLKRIALGTPTVHGEHRFEDISAVEIMRDGASITSTNRGAQVMGAAVGALLLGPLGLLLGGVSGSKRNTQKVKELALKITVNDRVAPVHQIIFFKAGGDGVSPKSSTLKRPSAQLENWNAHLVNAIRNAGAPMRMIDTPAKDGASKRETMTVWARQMLAASTLMSWSRPMN